MRTQAGRIRRPARLNRVEQNERNRAAILAAARAVFVEFGYHGATVDAVAGAAGMTIGAIYSRFASKADLFLALLEERIAERAVQFANVAADAGASPAAEFARRWTAVMRSDLAWSLLVIEFRVHAARDPELGRRYAALHERALTHLGDNIAASIPRDINVSRGRVDALARVAMAAGAGAALARAAEGDEFSDDLYVEISHALGAQFLGLEQL
jgi:AcrR family transcriptional regulator